MPDNLSFSALTHQGLVRENNEDQYATVTTQDGFPVSLILADGMGGHRNGELASQLACDYAAERLSASLQNGKEPVDTPLLLADVLQKANKKVYSASLEHEDNAGMGTTLMIALFSPEELTLVHVGDCRGYLLRNGDFQRLTHDHNVAQEMLDAGLISEYEANHHPGRNSLTQALGVPDFLSPEIVQKLIRPADRFLFCSDGLHGCVSPDAIAGVLQNSDTAEIANSHLLELALAAGAPDNVTVISVFVN